MENKYELNDLGLSIQQWALLWVGPYWTKRNSTSGLDPDQPDSKACPIYKYS